MDRATKKQPEETGFFGKWVKQGHTITHAMLFMLY